MDVLVRRATLSDLDALVALEASAFDPQRYHMLSRRQFRHLLARGHADIWVAEKDKKLVGAAVVLYRKRATVARLYSLAVHPHYQGQSIGLKLCEAVQERALEKGLQGLVCEAREDNPGLMRFYVRFGFVPGKQLPSYYADQMAGIKFKKWFNSL